VIPDKVLSGKNAIITGCARGIGKAMLENFAMHGANVWASARSPTPEFEARCAELANKYSVQIMPLCFDMTNKEEMKSVVKVVMKSELKVNVLVNNAGVTYNALHQLTAETALREQMEVNFFAPFLFTQFIVKLMLRHGSGSVINVASSAALDGNSGRAAYGASKAALLCATRALSREVGAQGVRANVIAPGITETDMIGSMTEAVIGETVAGTDMRRIGAPADIADVAVFLASDLSSYITGQVLRVDGGM
jgi:3-oxoacyl-[acyl-carrier protein] reductase